jgi:tRNA pseudouridine38-40 synthase
LHEVQLIPDYQAQAGLIAFEVRGDAFMKNMVRILAGTLVAVGRGTLTPEAVRGLLEPGQTRSRYSETAPAHGLTLINIRLGRAALSG